jgi:hypothetical protein
MPLFLNNDDVEKVITMKETMEALEILYRELGEGKAVGAPRSDLHVPTAASKNAEAPMAHYLKARAGVALLVRLRCDSPRISSPPGGDGFDAAPMPGNRGGIVMLSVGQRRCWRS